MEIGQIMNILIPLIIKNVKNYGLLYLSMEAAKIIGARMVISRNSKNYDGVIVDKDYVKNLERVNYDISTINLDELESIKETIQILLNSLTMEEKQCLYVNLQNLDVKKIMKLDLLLGVTGGYIPRKNRIEYFIKKILGHELLHVASTAYDKENDIILSGFSQTKGNCFIGKGLSEGYTELCAARMFNENGKINGNKEIVKIASLIEMFFDSPFDMRRLYFTHDLPGFIEHMSRFMEIEEVYQLINDLDKLRMYSLTTIPIDNFFYKRIINLLNKTFYNYNDSNDKFMEFYNICYKDKLNLEAFKIRRPKVEIIWPRAS